MRRLYALAELKPSISGFEVHRLSRVPYQTVSISYFIDALRLFTVAQTSSPGPPVHPRIQLICRGSIVIVQFGDAVALCSRGNTLFPCLSVALLTLFLSFQVLDIETD